MDIWGDSDHDVDGDGGDDGVFFDNTVDGSEAGADIAAGFPTGEQIASGIVDHGQSVVHNPALEQQGNELAEQILKDIDNALYGTPRVMFSGTPDGPEAITESDDALGHTDNPPTSTHEVRFSGGCDCGYNPNTCGAGHFCRWQR